MVEDTAYILMLGKRSVLRCLLEVHRLFNTKNPYHYLNRLFIDDYCVWVQGLRCVSFVYIAS